MNPLRNSFCLLLALVSGAIAQSIQPEVLYTFSNRATPSGDLTEGPDGNFYGASTYGGMGQGTVFKFTTNGIASTLVSFLGFNGSEPAAGLTLGNDGYLYGTTQYGGTKNDGETIDRGTVFKVTTNGILTTLAAFTGANGESPAAALTLGSDGTFYGTTLYGGSFGHGTVFKVTPNGALTTLISFDGTNGWSPHAALTLGNDGFFYGTTQSGGTNRYGTVFKMTSNGTLIWNISLSLATGANPQTRLVQGTDGNFYGATAIGGANDHGTIIKVHGWRADDSSPLARNNGLFLAAAHNWQRRHLLRRDHK